MARGALVDKEGLHKDLRSSLTLKRQPGIIPHQNLRPTPKEMSSVRNAERIKSSGSRSRPLACPGDSRILTEMMCLVRSQVEVFVVSPDDGDWRFRRAASRVDVGRVGIRCIHCTGSKAVGGGGDSLHPPYPISRNGAISYPKSIRLVSQSVRNFQREHLLVCPSVPGEVKERCKALKYAGKKSQPRSGSAQYWEETCRHMGMIDSVAGIKLRTGKFLSNDDDDHNDAAAEGKLEQVVESEKALVGRHRGERNGGIGYGALALEDAPAGMDVLKQKDPVKRWQAATLRSPITSATNASANEAGQRTVAGPSLLSCQPQPKPNDAEIPSTFSRTVARGISVSRGPGGPPSRSGRTSLLLHHPDDELYLNDVFCFLRHQVEAFIVISPQDGGDDKGGNKDGTKPPGRVGIRCAHCFSSSRLSSGCQQLEMGGQRLKGRVRRAVAFASSIRSVYQLVRNLQCNHFSGSDGCPSMPPKIWEEYCRLRDRAGRSSKGAPRYWEESCRRMGMVDSASGAGIIRLRDGRQFFDRDEYHSLVDPRNHWNVAATATGVGEAAMKMPMQHAIMAGCNANNFPVSHSRVEGFPSGVAAVEHANSADEDSLLDVAEAAVHATFFMEEDKNDLVQDLTTNTDVAPPDSGTVAALEHAASANEDSILVVAEAAVHVAFTKDKNESVQDLTADTGVAAPDSSIVAALEHAASANEDSLLAVAEAAVHAAFTEDKNEQVQFPTPDTGVAFDFSGEGDQCHSRGSSEGIASRYYMSPVMMNLPEPVYFPALNTRVALDFVAGNHCQGKGTSGGGTSMGSSSRIPIAPATGAVHGRLTCPDDAIFTDGSDQPDMMDLHGSDFCLQSTLDVLLSDQPDISSGDDKSDSLIPSSDEAVLDQVRLAISSVLAASQIERLSCPFPPTPFPDKQAGCKGSSESLQSEPEQADDEALTQLGVQLYELFSGRSIRHHGIDCDSSGKSIYDSSKGASNSDDAEDGACQRKKGRPPSALGYVPLSELGLPPKVCGLVSDLLGIGGSSAFGQQRRMYKSIDEVEKDLRLMASDPKKFLSHGKSVAVASRNYRIMPRDLYGRKEETAMLIEAYNRATHHIFNEHTMAVTTDAHIPGGRSDRRASGNGRRRRNPDSDGAAARPMHPAPSTGRWPRSVDPGRCEQGENIPRGTCLRSLERRGEDSISATPRAEEQDRKESEQQHWMSSSNNKPTCHRRVDTYLA